MLFGDAGIGNVAVENPTFIICRNCHFFTVTIPFLNSKNIYFRYVRNACTGWTSSECVPPKNLVWFCEGMVVCVALCFSSWSRGFFSSLSSRPKRYPATPNKVRSSSWAKFSCVRNICNPLADSCAQATGFQWCSKSENVCCRCLTCCVVTFWKRLYLVDSFGFFICLIGWGMLLFV